MLNLVLITREDPSLPLARLRAHNQLTEIRAGDLRFTNGEAGRFLHEVMGLSLSPADIAALDEKTEGWIVGLQLAAIALQSATPAATESATPVREPVDPSRFIASLSGSHRFILRYLTEEVLNQQPEEIRDFLLRTAILDRLSGDLCDAVTGRRDGQFMLERLFNANLFLIPLDDRQEWFRYHHLFADLLRDRQQTLQPDRTAELHRRASRWYAQADGEAKLRLGEHGAFVGEAVQHALAASDYVMAVQLVEDQALGMIMQGYFKTVKGWIEAIPRECSAQSPKANVAFAWLHFLRGTMAQAAPYLERLQAIFAGSQMDETDASLQAQWLALQSIVRNTEGKPTESLALANQALAIVPEMDHYVQSLIYLGLADAYQQVDDPARAAEAFQRIAYHGRAAANLVVEILGTAGSAAMANRRGHLYHAFEIASQGVDCVERSGSLPPISAAVYGALGYVSYQWDKIEDAHRYYLRATRVSALSGYCDTEILYLVTLSRLHQTEGDLEASAREIERAVDLIQGGAAAWLRPEVIHQQVRVLLAQDNPATAEVVLRQSGVSLQEEVTYATDGLHLASLRLMFYRGHKEHQKDKLRQAGELAHHIIASARSGQRMETCLQALVLGALAHSSSGDAKGSLELLDQALEMAEPEGYIRVFLDEGAPLAGLLRRAQERGLGSGYAKELLARFPSTASDIVLPPGSAGLIEPLSERELAVLRLIREGCSNDEIAQRLVITLYTVKKHNSNIYGKLGVNSRTQAVARARELRLL